MRTTLTLDPDVAAQLAAYQKANRKSLKGAVNELLRDSLRSSAKAKPGRKRKTLTKVFDAGEILIPNLDNTGEVLTWLDTIEWLEKHGPRAA